MYDYIDTNIASESVNILPPEALLINGEYIENLILGYRTLYVKGREALSPVLDTYDVGTRNGVQLKNKRFPERIITVGYQLICNGNQDFRKSYNRLAQILSPNESIMIFDDEPDKFFRGTLYDIGEIEPGRNCVTGEFKMICLDPLKYSVIQYEAVSSPEEDSILIDYKGTYRSHPVLEADFYKESEFGTSAVTGKGECGYVSFFNDEEQIIQLGDPDELDVEKAYEKSQTMMNQSFYNTTDFGSSQRSPWVFNAGKVIGNLAQTGDINMVVASYRASQKQKETSSVLMSEVSNKQDLPYVYYRVTAKSIERKASSVKIIFSITSWLNSGGWVGNGYGLKVAIYVGGSWHETVIKNLTAYWQGSAGHTVNITCVVSGINKDTTSVSGIKFRATRLDSIGGSWGTISARNINSMPIAKFIEDIPETYYLAPSGFGSGGSWHGPTMTRTIGADASGQTGAKHCTLTFKQLFDCKNTNQIGAFQVALIDTSGNVVAGARISKGNSGNTATLYLYVKTSNVYKVDINVQYGRSQVDVGTITKQGSSISFNIAGISKTFNESSLTNTTVSKAKFGFEKYQTKAGLNHNGLYYIKLVKNNCEQYRDIPNKFSANDVVQADCTKGEIKLNGILTPSLGALANNWEGFVLRPGLNQIGFSYSDWVDSSHKPTIRVKYREAYL